MPQREVGPSRSGRTPFTRLLLMSFASSFRFLLLILGLAPLALHAAEPASIEERLRALETKVGQLTQENSDLKKQLGVTPKGAPTVVTAAGKESKLSIGGFLQAQAEFGDAPDARFVTGDR